MLAATVALWRVLAIVVPLTGLALIGAYEIGVREGRLYERADVAKEALVSAQEWQKWLIERARKDDELQDTLRDIMIANKETERELNDVIEKTPDTGCVDDAFMRALRKLR